MRVCILIVSSSKAHIINKIEQFACHELLSSVNYSVLFQWTNLVKNSIIVSIVSHHNAPNETQEREKGIGWVVKICQEVEKKCLIRQVKQKKGRIDFEGNWKSQHSNSRLHFVCKTSFNIFLVWRGENGSFRGRRVNGNCNGDCSSQDNPISNDFNRHPNSGHFI